MNFSWISEALGRPPIGWRDVVDIAIVSILIYEVLTLIRGTRAVADGRRRRAGGRAVLRVATGRARDRELGDPQPDRLRRLCGDRAVSVRHPPRAGASGPRAVFPLSRQGRDGGRDGRRDRRGRADAVEPAHRRHHRHRASDRPAQLRRRRHPAGRADQLRPAGDDLSERHAAARRRGDHPGESRRRGRVLPAADRESAARARTWARAIARPSASPKKTTPSPSSCPRRPGGSRSCSKAGSSAT